MRSIHDALGDMFWRSEHLCRRNAKDFNALFCKSCIALHVALWAVTHVMGQSINFDDDPRFCAVEIDHEFADPFLPAEMDAIW